MKKIVISVCIVCILFLSCTTKNSSKEEKITQEKTLNTEDVDIDVSVLETKTPEVICTTGIVMEILENEGTFSEVRYFVLTGDKGLLTVLFNENGFSEGFKEWIGKQVSVQGYEDTGIIGFKRIKKTGIVVQSITTYP